MTTDLQNETALERQVREEQEAHESENDGATSDSAVSNEVGKPEDQLFSAADYDREDLQIAKIDGQSIDKIRVKFSGSVMLDRSDPADVALFNRLTLGNGAEIRAAGKVSGTGAGFTTNKDGDLDAVVGEKTLKVETVWVLEPEQLG